MPRREARGTKQAHTVITRPQPEWEGSINPGLAVALKPDVQSISSTCYVFISNPLLRNFAQSSILSPRLTNTQHIFISHYSPRINQIVIRGLFVTWEVHLPKPSQSAEYCDLFLYTTK